jgi:sulfoxide reductase heme-binding subunit YedZ
VSIWLWLRAAGVGAYVALFLSVAWGLVATTGVVTKRVSKPASNHFHAATGAAGLALLSLHMGLLVVHDFIDFDLVDVLVPWGAPYRPVATGLGVVAMYASVGVLASSWVRRRLSTRTWRAIHLLATPAFVLALLHGVFAGSDTDQPWMLALYGVTGVTTVFLLLVRAMTARDPRTARAAATTRPNEVREPASAA